MHQKKFRDDGTHSVRAGLGVTGKTARATDPYLTRGRPAGKLPQLLLVSHSPAVTIPLFCSAKTYRAGIGGTMISCEGLVSA
jgi:hypothetical protein